MVVYTPDFFTARQMPVKRAAGAIIPLVLEFLQPSSVVDIGCGTGDFLEVFREYGVHDILGIDGDYVDRSCLAIDRACFRPMNLELPFTLERVYDLAICLEVAEHLEPQSADDFIASLTQAAPAILFSAAIPLQVGVGHLNEQWPEYWAALFKKHGFVPVDVLRRRVWHNQEIPFWYRQNMLFFCSEQLLTGNGKLAAAASATNLDVLSIVHPELYLQYALEDQQMRQNTGRLIWHIKQVVKIILRKR